MTASNRPTQASRRRSWHAASGLLLLASGVASLVGCAQLIGLEKRTAEPGVLDEETQIVTTVECQAYCDTVLENCRGDHAVYTTRTTCLGVCNALDPGNPDEPFGNTLACRYEQAVAAEDAPDELCPAAGPPGDGVCGDDCEAYCDLLAQACPDEFAALSDCEDSCAALTDAGPYDVTTYYTGDTLQCRFIHLSTSFSEPDPHCGHAEFVAKAQCVDEATDGGDPSCDSFCRNVAGACPGSFATYESQAQCMATCAEWPVGALDDREELTVGCRQYHAGAALSAPETHCQHTGPGGDGMCSASTAAGNCEGYCLLLEPACATAFDEVGGTQELCQEACLEAFAEDGAAAGSGYSVEQALEGGLQCRMLMLSRALEGTAAACDHVRATDECPEP